MARLTARQALALALQLNAAGRWVEAERICRRLLAAWPQDAAACLLLGVILVKAGRSGEAEAPLRQAIRLEPRRAETHCCLGDVLKERGDLDGAAAAYRAALAHNPDLTEAHANLGAVLRARGDIAGAIAACHRALALRPDLPELHFNLGNALQDAGDLDGAIAAYREAITLAPAYVEALANLGVLLRRTERFAGAVAVLRKASDLRPGSAEILTNLGSALKDDGQTDEAIAAFRRALDLAPDHRVAHFNLGNALRGQGRMDEAAESYRRAITLRPNSPEALINLGVVHRSQGDLDAADAADRQAIDLRPDFQEAHFNLSQILLLKGAFAEGWREYEWRLRADGHKTRRRPEFPQPRWQGEDIAGKTLLLHVEQGLGDLLHFARFVPIVAKRGARVVVEVYQPLARLFAALPGVAQVVVHGEPLPPFDVQLPMMSLAGVLGVDRDSIPAEVPYLVAEPSWAAAWKGRLGDGAKGRAVGVVWAGSPTHQADRARSIAAAKLLPRLAMPGVRLVSLQKVPREGDAAVIAALGGTALDLGPDLADFADTAGLMAHLDLVISVDTAVAHLAGALGRPVWTLIPVAPDWRWMTGRDDSPWYPSMRLFRQTRPDDWGPTIDRLVKELAAWALKPGP